MRIPVRLRAGAAVALLPVLAACGGPPSDLTAGPRVAPRWERTPVIFVPGINREVGRLLRDSLFDLELLTLRTDAETIAKLAAEKGYDLRLAYAYSDSASDLPMLEAVGHAVAVNPEAKLAAVARKRGWHVEQWSTAPGGTKPLLPMAARQ